jgi:pyruvate/2-oxoglutarate dehydrogenase complex dihydrolipoamide acyltransferase (E2) component
MSLLNELRIPHMGSVENAKILNWLVAEGAAFSAGQALYEIETDKTVLEVEAEADGVLARCEAREGDERKVGDRVGYVAAAGAAAGDIAAALRALDAPSTTEAAAPMGQVSAEVSADAAEPEPAAVRHSPLVRRLAAEHGVDLTSLRGSGPGGKVTGDDVLAAAGQAAGGVPAVPGYEGVPFHAVANSARRRAIARRLSEAARQTAALTADMQVDLGALLARRAEVNAARKARGEEGVSVLACVAKALAAVLRARPAFNATFTDSHYVLWDAVNLGIAVDTPDGLVVPVIRAADRLDVVGLTEAIRALAQRARDGQLRPDELDGGTFTLSNPGSVGPVLRAEAIINPPQVALLGLPAMLHTPVALPDGAGGYRVEVRPVMRPSLTFDHRALDGGQVIEFLNDLRLRLEQDVERLFAAV